MKNFRMFIQDLFKGRPIFQYLAAYTGILSTLCSGMHYGWPSPAFPQLFDTGSAIPITNEEGSWVAVMLLLGSACGSIIVALTLDKIGRKKLILLSTFPPFVAWIMVAYSRSFTVLILARFVAGITDAFSYCGLTTYIGEIADSKIRGSLGSNIVGSWVLGVLLINIIGFCLSIRTTALVSCVFPVFCLLTFCWMPESPYYLIMKGNLEEAKRSLRIFKGTEDIESELNRLIKVVAEQKENTGRYLDLFTVRSNRKAFMVTIGLRTVQLVAGVTPIIFYAQTIFEEAVEVISSSVAVIIYFSLEVVLCGCCAILVDKSGRRPLLIISTIGVGLALFTEAFYLYLSKETNIDTTDFNWISPIAFIVIVIMFNIGLQTLPTLLSCEIFPMNVKVFALTFAAMYYCIFATVVSKFFQITKDGYGLYLSFCGCAVGCIFGLIFIVVFVPETKGKTLEEIQQVFKAETKKGEVPKTEIFNKIAEP